MSDYKKASTPGERPLKSEAGLIFTDRDKKVLFEVNRWKAPLGRHVMRLGEFTGLRATDRRLKKLIDAGYLERKHYIYGVPGIYSITAKAKGTIGLRYYKYSIRLDEIHHDICVLDTAIYIHEVVGVPYSDILTERELHGYDGFSNRKHQPDFIYRNDGKTYAVEVELTPKSRQRFETNVKGNYLTYDAQLWIVPNSEYRVKQMLEQATGKYPNIEVISLDEIKAHIGNEA